MTLDEIFKTKPELLKEAEVLNLINYVQNEHARTVDIYKKYRKFHDDVLELCMYSNVALKEGKSAEFTLNKIFELLSTT